MPLALYDEIADPAADVDEKDVLMRDFLIQFGKSRSVNQFYHIGCNFTTPPENPTHQVSTIAPIQEDELFSILRAALINMLPNSKDEDMEVKYPKVFEFFDWMNSEIAGYETNPAKTPDTIDK